MRLEMSLPHTPSPSRGVHWSSNSSPTPPYRQTNGHAVSWTAAKARSAKVNGFSPVPGGDQGFLGRHFRRLSLSLPRFNGTRYNEKDKPIKNAGFFRNLLSIIGRQLSHLKLGLVLILLVLASVILFYETRECV